jgi:Sigma-70 region 2
MNSTEQLTSPLEESAFAALVERHHGELQVHCYRMLGSVQDVEDLVQETFLCGWRHRASFRATAAAWLAHFEAHADQFTRLEAPGAFAQRQADRRAMLDAIDAGLLRRVLVLARRR